MKLIIALSLLLFSCSPKDENLISKLENMTFDETNLFGAKPAMSTEPISLTNAISSKKIDQAIRITSHVTNVCSKKGCWLILQENDKNVRVTFKDYGFFVPLDFKDVDVVLEGILSEKVVKEEERKHYAEDQGMSKEEVENIKGDELQYTFEATSVIKI